MPFGDFLAKKGVVFKTAEGGEFKIKSILEVIALRLLGIPHVGFRIRARKILTNLNPAKDALILDAGCGVGYYPLFLAKQGYKPVGVDISLDKVKIAKQIAEEQRLPAEFIIGDVNNLPLKNNKFDRVICVDVLEHIKTDDIVLHEFNRILSKKGYALISVPSVSKYNQQVSASMHHVRVGYSLQDFEQKLTKAQFIITTLTPYQFKLTILSKCLANYLVKKSRILLATLFYPLFLLALIGENIKTNEYDCLFAEVRKRN